MLEHSNNYLGIPTSSADFRTQTYSLRSYTYSIPNAATQQEIAFRDVITSDYITHKPSPSIITLALRARFTQGNPLYIVNNFVDK